MLNFIPTRIAFVLIAVACASLLGYGLYLQHVEWLDPCPLCILQRIGFMLIAFFALLAAIHDPGPRGRRVYGTMILLSAGFGGGVAGWHARMQSLPADLIPECGPGLGYMLENFPFWDAVRNVFEGSGSCAEVDWMFLGLSMPWWSLFWFIGLGAVTLVILLRNTPRKSRDK